MAGRGRKKYKRKFISRLRHRDTHVAHFCLFFFLRPIKRIVVAERSRRRGAKAEAAAAANLSDHPTKWRTLPLSLSRDGLGLRPAPPSTASHGGEKWRDKRKKLSLKRRLLRSKWCAPPGRSCILHDDTGLRGPGGRPPKTEGIIESLSAHPALFCV